MIPNKDVSEVIKLQSKMIASTTGSLYITEDRLFFGSHQVERDNIDEINIIQDTRVDKTAVAVIAVNFVSGSILSYILFDSVYTFLLMCFLTLLLGYGLVKFVRDTPHSYVSLETEDAEYRFGTATPVDTARLFSKVYQSLDKDLNYDSFEMMD